MSLTYGCHCGLYSLMNFAAGDTCTSSSYGKAVLIEASLAGAMGLDQVFQKQELYHLNVTSYGVFQCFMKCHVSLSIIKFSAQCYQAHC